jgi:hypothetical protein
LDDRSNFGEQQQSLTTKNYVNSGTIVGGPAATVGVGGDGGVNNNDETTRRLVQSVTITDPRTGKKRVVRVSNNDLKP